MDPDERPVNEAGKLVTAFIIISEEYTNDTPLGDLLRKHLGP